MTKTHISHYTVALDFGLGSKVGFFLGIIDHPCRPATRLAVDIFSEYGRRIFALWTTLGAFPDPWIKNEVRVSPVE